MSQSTYYINSNHKTNRFWNSSSVRHKTPPRVQLERSEIILRDVRKLQKQMKNTEIAPERGRIFLMLMQSALPIARY